MPDQSKRAEPKDPRIEAALRQYLERIDHGESVNAEEFLSQHAEIADDLRSFLTAEDEVRKLAGVEVPRDRAQDSTKSFVGHGQETLVPQSMGERPTESLGTSLTGQFGRYRIIRTLGSGAMGAVYLAEDTQLERQVAIKTPHFEDDPTGDLVARFYREARAAAILRHANICPVYDVGEIEGKRYISMAYIEGRPLSALIRADKPQSERSILIALHKLSLALQQAHDHGIVHRDLKPANIMVDKQGEPVIMDFGLARKARKEGDASITHSGIILGSPAYMSPEQATGDWDVVGPASDQYSLGVILYEMLTSQLPFRGSVVNVLAQIVTKEPTRPSELRAGIDPRIETICLKMLAKKASDRFSSLKAVADELATILKSPAGKSAAKEKPATASHAPPGAPERPTEASARASQAGASVKQSVDSLKSQALTANDLASLEELARKCYSRREYEQVIQVIERVPEACRGEPLQGLLQQARDKADEIALLICDMDEAVRRKDRPTARKTAEELLKIKPGHQRALTLQQEFSESGAGVATRIGPLRPFTKRWNEGGWIPWSALAFGLAFFGVVAVVVVIHRNGTAIVVDIQDPAVVVTVKGPDVVLTGPKKEQVTVTPGDQELTITCADLKFTTEKFTLKTGDKPTVTVSMVNKEIVARLGDEILPLTSAQVAKTSSPTAAGKSPLPLPTPSQGEKTTIALTPAFTNRLGLEFVLVPKGKSWLGGGGGRPGGKEEVIAGDFYLGKYEVTQQEWVSIMHSNPSYFQRNGGGRNAVVHVSDAELTRFPVERVSWDAAQVFLKHLNKEVQETGWIYRLPTQAEWEYACRGGPLSDQSESAYHFYLEKPADQLLPEQANFQNDKGLKRTCKVGSYKPNRLGLYDMHGNVWELCDDAEQTVDGEWHRVARGGSWYFDSRNCEAAFRITRPPKHQLNNRGLGLRVARVLIGQQSVTVPAEEKKPADAVPGPAAVGPKLNVATTAAKFSGRPFLVRGDWTIENEELVQHNLASGARWNDDDCPTIILGEPNLSNYDLTLEVKKTGGRGHIGVFFHWLGTGHRRAFYLSGNNGIDFSFIYNGKWGREEGNGKRLNYSSNRWYSLKVEVRGDTFRAYLDDLLQFEQTDARFTQGRICLLTDTATARFRRIKLSDPQGKVLFEGLPELPSPSDKTTQPVHLGDSPRSLTAGETVAKHAQQRYAERLKTPVISTNSLGTKLALIPPGEFEMGSPEAEPGRGGDEQQNRVRITKPFSLGVYEITQSEFERVMRRNRSFFLNVGGPTEATTGVDLSRHPVENVTWQDAVEFCNKLSEKEGRKPYYRLADIKREGDGSINDAKVTIEGGQGYRLPTEAEWEYACRAGTTTPFNFGTINNATECNCNGQAPYGIEEQGPMLARTVPVGSYQPNAFGLYDMHGNVWEWCRDWYGDKLVGGTDPTGPSNGPGFVSRGGGWNSPAKACRSANRGRNRRGLWGISLGFRAACDVVEGESPPKPAIAPSADGVSNAPPDPDRRAAEAMLALGGSITIRVNGRDQRIEPGNVLPTTDFALRQIRHFTNGRAVTDADLKQFQPLRQLQVLRLAGTAVTDAGLVYLRQLTSLEVLGLGGLPITDAGLANLSGLTSLRRITAFGTRITDAGLAHLAALKNLEYLQIGGTKVTDAGLLHLKEMTRLKVLRAPNTRVTAAGAAQLKKSLPECQMIFKRDHSPGNAESE